MRLVLSRRTTDEAMGMLVRRFPALASLEVKRENRVSVLTDEALRAVSSLPALTSIDLSYCHKVTAAGVQALAAPPPPLEGGASYHAAVSP